MGTWSQHADILIAQRTPQAPANSEWIKLGATIEDQVRQSFERFVTQEETSCATPGCIACGA